MSLMDLRILPRKHAFGDVFVCACLFEEIQRKERERDRVGWVQNVSALEVRPLFLLHCQNSPRVRTHSQSPPRAAPCFPLSGYLKYAAPGTLDDSSQIPTHSPVTVVAQLHHLLDV